MSSSDSREATDTPWKSNSPRTFGQFVIFSSSNHRILRQHVIQNSILLIERLLYSTAPPSSTDSKGTGHEAKCFDVHWSTCSHHCRNRMSCDRPTSATTFQWWVPTTRHTTNVGPIRSKLWQSSHQWCHESWRQLFNQWGNFSILISSGFRLH